MLYVAHLFISGAESRAATLVENGNENEDMIDDVVLQQCTYFISTAKGKSSKCKIHAMHSWWTIKPYKDAFDAWSNIFNLAINR
jgi:hypothetical protein